MSLTTGQQRIIDGTIADIKRRFPDYHFEIGTKEYAECLAFLSGVKARSMGRHANPYSLGTKAGNEWQAGYNSAEGMRRADHRGA